MADRPRLYEKYLERMKAGSAPDPINELAKDMLSGADKTVNSILEDPVIRDAVEAHQRAEELKKEQEAAAPTPTAPETPAAATSNEEEKTEVANANVIEALPDEKLEDVMAELEALVGLDDIKEHMKTLVNLLKVQKSREEHGLPTIQIGLHRLFVGNPGTGKTTVARFMGRLYKAAGRLSKGHLVETDRSGLVGGFVGQTALKTKEVLESAKGGVLFLDEAYSLVPEDGGNDFGQEAITTILKFMEDNRDDFVFIGAGYPYEMERFINSNSGFASRFNEIMDFADYDAEQLFEIFETLLEKNHYTLNKAGKEKVKEDLKWYTENKNANFANGRLVRKYFEELVQNQANRLGKQTKELSKAQVARIALSDFPKDLSKLM